MRGPSAGRNAESLPRRRAAASRRPALLTSEAKEVVDAEAKQPRVGSGVEGARARGREGGWRGWRGYSYRTARTPCRGERERAGTKVHEEP